jgi:hypothetical protein
VRCSFARKLRFSAGTIPAHVRTHLLHLPPLASLRSCGRSPKLSLGAAVLNSQQLGERFFWSPTRKTQNREVFPATGIEMVSIGKDCFLTGSSKLDYIGSRRPLAVDAKAPTANGD